MQANPLYIHLYKLEHDINNMQYLEIFASIVNNSVVIMFAWKLVVYIWSSYHISNLMFWLADASIR